jgi:hypothetical protein
MMMEVAEGLNSILTVLSSKFSHADALVCISRILLLLIWLNYLFYCVWRAGAAWFWR